MRGTTPAEFADEVNLDHPLSARRVPVLSNPFPRWKYHVAVVINPDEDALYGPSLEPTPEEAEQLVAYLDYRLTDYYQHYREQMRQRPFDVDGTINTYTFRKDPTVGWQYNAMTWTLHVWFPQIRLHEQRFETLEALIDHIHTYGGELYHRWAEFKATSPAFRKD